MSSSQSEKTVFDLEEFLFLLAVELCSHEKMKETLERKPPNSFRLYWRSPILCSMEVMDNNIIFLDATWEFTKTSSTLCWGVLVAKEETTRCCYYKGSPMDLTTLQECMNQISIHLQTSESHSIAKMMAEATVNLKGNIRATVSSNSTIAIQLYYSAVQDTGNLLLPSPINRSYLDDIVMDLLLKNIALSCTNPSFKEKSSHDTTHTTKPTDLWKLFQEWKQHRNKTPGLHIVNKEDLEKTNPNDNNPTVHRPTTTVDVQDKNSKQTVMSAPSLQTSKFARQRVAAPMQRTGSNKKRKTRITYSGRGSQK